MLVISTIIAAVIIFSKEDKPDIMTAHTELDKAKNTPAPPIETLETKQSAPVVQSPPSIIPSVSSTSEKYGEIIEQKNNEYLGNYYVVRLRLQGFEPSKINVDIKADTSEAALNKIVKIDDYILVRTNSKSESVYVARYGKIIHVWSDFTVPESSPVGSSYQSWRFGAEVENVMFEGYGGLNGEMVIIEAKRFFILRDNSLNVDTDYIWNYESNRAQYDIGLKTFNTAIKELGSAKKEFDPDDPLLWKKILIPATQALLVATMSGKETEVKSIYDKITEKFGNIPVDFLKDKLSLQRVQSQSTQIRKIDELAIAQQAQDQLSTKPEISINPQVVDSSQADIIGLWDCEEEMGLKYSFDDDGNVKLNAVRWIICRVDSPLGNPPQLRQSIIGLCVDWRFATRNRPTNLRIYVQSAR